MKNSDKPLINDNSSQEYTNLINEIINNKHILEAVPASDSNSLELKYKFPGIMMTVKELKISKNTISKYLDTGISTENRSPSHHTISGA